MSSRLATANDAVGAAAIDRATAKVHKVAHNGERKGEGPSPEYCVVTGPWVAKLRKASEILATAFRQVQRFRRVSPNCHPQ